MKVVVQNLAVEYMDEGNGPVVLLLHGWKSDLHTFDPLISALVGSFRVIRLGLPGFGGSEVPRESWGGGEYALFVKAFIQKLGISVDTLIGHSFGGRITLKGVGFGELHPKKVVLIASAGLAKHKTVRNRLFGILAKLGKVLTFVFPASVRRSLRRRLYQATGSSDYLNAGVLKETSLKVIREDLSGYAKGVEVPTLLIWGEGDIATPLSDGKRLAELISGSRLEIVEGAGHFVHQERPKEVAELIKKFVSQ